MENRLINKLDNLPYEVYYEGKEYLLNLNIHNDGVNIDYCDGEDELFCLGMSYDENYCCKSEVLNAIIDKALAIIKDELWRIE